MNVCQTLPGQQVALPAGPFVPGQEESAYFAFYADDCLLHFTAEELTPRQQADHESNVVLTAMLHAILQWIAAVSLSGGYVGPEPGLFQLMFSVAVFPILAWLLLRAGRVFRVSI